MSTPRLEVRHASKTFGNSTVLDDVSLTVRPGRVHGLIGQNGCGKSTLLKLLSGFHRPDPGAEFLVDGRPVGPPVHPRQLRRAGVSFVHQDLGLDLLASVADNVRMGRFTYNRFTRNIDSAAERRAVRATLDRLGADIDPGRPVGTLPPTVRGLVAIARALQDAEPGHGLIVFDESTQSMPKSALARFYRLVRQLAQEGTSILLVSHRLDEVMHLCDAVTVLRDGRKMADVDRDATDEAQLTRLMLGREPERLTPGPERQRDRPTVLTAAEVRGGDLDGAGVELHAGEIVGVVGLPGSGYEELPYALAGVLPHASGTVTVGGRSLDLAHATPRQTIAAGLALIPGSRAEQGLAPELTALENVSVPRLTVRSSRWNLSNGWQLAEFTSMAGRLGVTPLRPDMPVAAFSGGNQQKLLLAKWLLNQPQVLLLHEPTQAVDVGARRDILAALRSVAETGTAVLISSVEPDDLAAVCDRVLVVESGRVAAELRGPLTPDAILDALYPSRTAALETIS
jgi:ribose transport system ATP-binding protein